MDITINVEEMTLGQAEFWSDYTGRTLGEMEELLEDQRKMKVKDIVAFAAIAQNPEDPAAALPDIRGQRIVLLQSQDD